MKPSSRRGASFAVLAFFFLLITSASRTSFGAAGLTWVADPPQAPQDQFGLVAYDSVNHRTLVFGSVNDAGATSDLWSWDGAHWTILELANPSEVVPSPAKSVMTFDDARGKLVLFDGKFTWEWSPGDGWERTATAGPATSYDWYQMVYDGAHAVSVLVWSTSFSFGTWTYDGKTSHWSQAMPSTSPSPRFGAALAFDPIRQNVVLFGGFQAVDNTGDDDAPPAQNTVLDDTWLWDGTAWQQAMPALSPGTVMGPELGDTNSMGAAADTNGHLIVAGSGFDPAGSVWSWDGVTWSMASPPTNSPTARVGTSLAYDASRKRSVLFGTAADNVLWEWDGKSWARPSSQLPAPLPTTVGSPMAFDSDRHVSMLFDGTNLEEWDGAIWHHVQPATSDAPPAGLQFFSLAYDSARKLTLVFGGGLISPTGSTAPSDSLWAWNAATLTWSLLQPTGPAPSARFGPSATFDSARGVLVIVSGYDQPANADDDGPAYADTWEWNGTAWNNVTPAAGNPTGTNISMAFDSVRNVSVWEGNVGGRTTYEWTGTAWNEKQTAAGSYLPYMPSLAFDTQRKLTIAVSCSTAGCMTSTWDGTAWALEAPLVVPTARGGASAVYHAGRGLMMYGGQNETLLAQTWVYGTIGTSCTSNADCEAGCVDGVCCSTASCATCQTCNGGSPGTCTDVQNAPDPDSCDGSSICDPNGRCLGSYGAACTTTNDCAVGTCADGVCCTAACDGQCEACNQPGSVGTCEAVVGLPRAGHVACPLVSASVPCDALSCDGHVRTACVALAGAAIACGSASCTGDVLTPSGHCNGGGACIAGAAVTCPSFLTCDAVHDACLMACSRDADCAQGECDPTTKTCFSGAFCKDEHTATSASGVATDCTPYKCQSNGTCVSTCASIVDCAAGNICNEGHVCALPIASSASSDGCAVSPTAGSNQDEGPGAVALLFGAALVFGRKTRTRSERARSRSDHS